MHERTHPALIHYGTTAAPHHDFPLVLVVGREPNDAGRVAMELGTYDFDASPRCGFWNMAYGLLGRMHASGAPRTTAWLKEHCRSRGASPIVMADAIPQGQLDAVRDKDRLRRDLAGTAAEHAAGVLAIDDRLTRRIQLILVSGLGGKVFQSAVEGYRDAAAARGIPCASIPFLSPLNARKFFAADVSAGAKAHLQARYLAACVPPEVIERGAGIVSDFLEVPTVDLGVPA